MREEKEAVMGYGLKIDIKPRVVVRPNAQKMSTSIGVGNELLPKF